MSEKINYSELLGLESLVESEKLAEFNEGSIEKVGRVLNKMGEEAGVTKEDPIKKAGRLLNKIGEEVPLPQISKN